MANKITINQRTPTLGDLKVGDMFRFREHRNEGNVYMRKRNGIHTSPGSIDVLLLRTGETYSLDSTDVVEPITSVCIEAS